ncbi:TPA: hypothetical protein ACJI3N_005376 [Raoultella planticola]
MSEVKKVITVADRSTKALAKTAQDLSKIVLEINGLSASTVTLAEEIEYKQSELDDLANKYEIRVAEEENALRLKVLANEDKVLADLMKKRGFATVSQVDFEKLNSDLEVANTNNEFAVSEAREAGYKEASVALNAQIGQLKSSHSVEMAEFKAQATAKDLRVRDLEAQVADLRNQIDAERQTRLEIAKADAGRQGVVVNAGKN